MEPFGATPTEDGTSTTVNTAVTVDITLDMASATPSDPETGSAHTDLGTEEVTFTEIDNVQLGSGDGSIAGALGDDIFIDTGGGADFVHAQGGDDTFTLAGLDEAGAGPVAIAGGETDETLGDRLNLAGTGDIADLVTLTAETAPSPRPTASWCRSPGSKTSSFVSTPAPGFSCLRRAPGQQPGGRRSGAHR